MLHVRTHCTNLAETARLSSLRHLNMHANCAVALAPVQVSKLIALATIPSTGLRRATIRARLVAALGTCFW